MKTLSQQIQDIKDSTMTFSEKKSAIISLGIREFEADYLLSDVRHKSTPRVPSYTFGVEIECGVPRRAFGVAAAHNNVDYAYEGYNHNDGHAHFKMVSDGSLSISDSIECVSPVLKGANGKKKLQAVCKALNEAGASVNSTCGLHVHIGASDLTDIQYGNVFVNYYFLEKVIDSFMANSRRASNNYYCRSLGYDGMREETFKSRASIREFYTRRAGSCARYHKVNPVSYLRHGTIEFRQHQGTTNFNKIYNWVQFCAKLVQWSKTHVLRSFVLDIDEIPFLTKKEKEFFKAAAQRLSA